MKNYFLVHLSLFLKKKKDKEMHTRNYKLTQLRDVDQNKIKGRDISCGHPSWVLNNMCQLDCYVNANSNLNEFFDGEVAIKLLETYPWPISLQFSQLKFNEDIPYNHYVLINDLGSIINNAIELEIDLKWTLFKYNATPICFSLQDMKLPALQILEILDALLDTKIVPFHKKWNLITTIKHFNRC